MNLSTSINFDIKHFFQWWGRGLAYWIPEKIKPLFSEHSSYVFLSVKQDVLDIKRIAEGQEKVITQLLLNEATPETFQQLLLQHEDLQKAKYILRLQAKQAIKKIIYLPEAAKENLQQVLAFEMDKYTPFKAEQVYFSAKLLGKEANEQLKVMLVLSPKKTLDGIYQQLKRLEIYPDFADYERQANDYIEDLQPYNLLPSWDVPVKNKMRQSLTWLSCTAFLLLTIAILAFPVWQEGQIVESLRLQLKQLEKNAQLVQAQQLEMDELVEETVRLIKVKENAASVTELIDALSQLIPNDSWLTHLKYNDKRFQIQGQSPAASALIGLLEASPLFSNTRFVSPLTQDKRTGKERFQISVDVNVRMGENNE